MSEEVEFLTRMSHEMRTPLSAILGYAQLMASGAQAPTAAQQRSLDLILQAGWHLEKLINTTRDLALIEAGTLPLSLECLSLAAVMLDCQALIESQAQARRVHVMFPVFAAPCFVVGDGIRVQQVLVNLLAIAIERSAVGGAVLVDYAIAGAEGIRISISDALHHEPIPSQDLGICVLLARRLVELMGGANGPDNALGTVTALSFTLKRADVPVNAGRARTDFHTNFTAVAAATASVIPR
jgi:signal transduction histidine kinase